ncbi:MAG: amino acid--tRNA ligase-related protein [bacterium]|nr:amino acid--tRNA ligase-related protein [bacterium]
MLNNYIATKDIKAYSDAVNALRRFFLAKGFCEVHTQDRLSILAACEDPTTIATYRYSGSTWPLPQTGQMWLEYELLKNPGLPGVFCVSTSFRQEPNPIPGRHEQIFPMFEFEAPGTIDDLKVLEAELCEHLEFGLPDRFEAKTYEDAALHYAAAELNAEHEMRMWKDFGDVMFLERFPIRTSPFWNMRRDGSYARKIDVVLCGMETIGSAERSCDRDEMRRQFHTISGGQYAEKLYRAFGKDRVEAELEGFLSLKFFERFGGGIGMTRLMRALQLKVPASVSAVSSMGMAAAKVLPWREGENGAK